MEYGHDERCGWVEGSTCEVESGLLPLKVQNEAAADEQVSPWKGQNLAVPLAQRSSHLGGCGWKASLSGEAFRGHEEPTPSKACWAARYRANYSPPTRSITSVISTPAPDEGTLLLISNRSNRLSHGLRLGLGTTANASATPPLRNPVQRAPASCGVSRGSRKASRLTLVPVRLPWRRSRVAESIRRS